MGERRSSHFFIPVLEGKGMKVIIFGMFFLLSVPALAAEHADQPKLDGYQAQIRSMYQWNRQFEQAKSEQSGEVVKLLAEEPVSVIDVERAVKAYRAAPSAAESLEAMQMVFLAADLMEGKQQALAQDHVSEIEKLVIEYHANNPQLFDFLFGISLSSSKSELLENVLAKAKDRQIKAQIAKLLVDQAVSILDRLDLSPQQRAEHRARGEKYAKLYIDDLGSAVPNMEIAGKSIPLDLWRVKGALFDLKYLGLGQELPNLQFVDLNGQADGTDNYAGKVMLIDFWTTWCGPCKASLPHIADMTEELSDLPFQMISVACDEEVEPVIEFRKEEQPMPWVNWHSPSLTEQGELLGISAYPTYFVVDEKRIIRMKSHDFKEVESMVRQLSRKAGKS